MIQNKAVRIVTHQRRSDHITDTLKMLHWIPVKYHIEYKMVLFAYKSQYDTVHVYLTDLLFPCVPPRTLRSQQQLGREQPRAQSKKYAECASSVAALSLWNDVPFKLKQADTLDL